MLPVLTFLGDPSGRLTIIVAAVAALVALRAADVRQHHAVGEKRAVAKIEKANEKSTEAGKRAAARAADPGVRSGQRDPSTRDE